MQRVGVGLRAGSFFFGPGPRAGIGSCLVPVRCGGSPMRGDAMRRISAAAALLAVLLATPALAGAAEALPPPISSPVAVPGSLPPPIMTGGFLVFFDWNKDEITSQAAAILDNVAASYRPTADAQVQQTGHVQIYL